MMEKSQNIESRPVVSVIVCTYNQEQYISQTLDSILMQQCDFDFEILVGEDNGPDSTRSICEQYASKYSQVKVLDRPHNLGKQKNFFDALIKCKGKYISMCDGDDYWQDPLMLQKEVDYLEANPDCVIVYHDSIMVDRQGNVISETEVGKHNKRDFSNEELVKGVDISNRTICFRNIVDFSKIDTSLVYNEDMFVYAVIGQYGSGHYIDGLKPSVYRVLDGSIWSTMSEIKQIWLKFGTIKALQKYYGADKTDWRYKHYIDLYYQNCDRILYKSVQNNEKTYLRKVFMLNLKSFSRKGYIKSVLYYVKCILKKK